MQKLNVLYFSLSLWFAFSVVFSYYSNSMHMAKSSTDLKTDHVILSQTSCKIITEFLVVI